ncbi:hypothetical protein K488DRAFT_26962, partial [Vararia minispora EC-137]
RCSKCKLAFYCGSACQKKDWKAHKKVCDDLITSPPPWYYKHSWNRDCGRHEGELELITWDCRAEGTGWGHCCREESASLKRKFENQFDGNLERFYNYWPQAFRWKCCGMDASMDSGCDHHGTGSKPCTCDFCRGGKPLPDRIYKDPSASRMGLALPRGPDPRS